MFFACTTPLVLFARISAHFFASTNDGKLAKMSLSSGTIYSHFVRIYNIPDFNMRINNVIIISRYIDLITSHI